MPSSTAAPSAAPDSDWNFMPPSDMVDSFEPKIAKWAAAEGRMIGAFDDSNRQQHMAVVRQTLGCHVDVAEIYSPPRICVTAKSMGLREGFSLDLTAPRAN